MSRSVHGDQAVLQASQYYGVQGAIDPLAEHIIREEGFNPGTYGDSKGIQTGGVGATGDMIGKNFFTEVMPVYYKRARDATGPGFSQLSEGKQKAVLSAVYRGDMGPKTKELIKARDWKGAAAEYLDHAEFRKGLKPNATQTQKAVSERMARNAQEFAKVD